MYKINKLIDQLHLKNQYFLDIKAPYKKSKREVIFIHLNLIEYYKIMGTQILRLKNLTLPRRRELSKNELVKRDWLISKEKKGGSSNLKYTTEILLL